MAGYFVTRKKRVVVELDEIVFLSDCKSPEEAKRRALSGEGQLLRGSEKYVQRKGRDKIIEAEEVMEA
ncbi:MAG: hypothetical protein K1X56_11155 [Flavobacteriales bacterium]|nr:hypothetical protein [Flavobacteriales bacterium]